MLGSGAVWGAMVLAGTAAAQDVQRILAQYDDLVDKVDVAVSGSFGRLRNSRTEYVLQALAQSSVRRASLLGMTQPIFANFYGGGFIWITTGSVATGKRVPTLSLGTDRVGRQVVHATWTLPQGAITTALSLEPASEALMVRVSTTIGGDKPVPLMLRLHIYPQSFNRGKHGTPRANFALTSDGRRVDAPVTFSPDPAVRWVYLGDGKYRGRCGGAAVGVAPRTLRMWRVHGGTYGMLVDLHFNPARTFPFFLVDYGPRELPSPTRQVPPLLEAETARFDAWRTPAKPPDRK